MIFLFKPSFWKALYNYRFVFAILSLLLIVMGLYEVFFIIKPDYTQGDLIKIFFLHVPFAWLSILIYAILSVAAFIFLVFKFQMTIKILESGSFIGTVFTALTLITGSIWGKAAWGTWWTWDARLTSVLVLFFIYMGINVLRSSMRNTPKAYRILSCYILFGALNIPVIKFSVQWWNTLHQPATVSKNVFEHMDSSYLFPLVCMFLGFGFWGVFLGIVGVKK